MLHRDVKGSNILLTHTAEVGDDDVDDDDHHGADHYSKDVHDNNDDDYDNADDLQVRLVDYGVSCTLADEEERRRSRGRRLMMVMMMMMIVTVILIIKMITCNNHDGGDAKVGTPYWMAPEVILSGEVDSQEYDQRADVWS